MFPRPLDDKIYEHDYLPYFINFMNILIFQVQNPRPRECYYAVRDREAGGGRDGRRRRRRGDREGGRRRGGPQRRPLRQISLHATGIVG